MVFGDSPVAQALSALAYQFHWSVLICTDDLPPAAPGARRLVIISTQGAGDLPALRASLQSGSGFIAFVGSRRKFATLSDKLQAEGASRAALEQIHAPAGLAIDAVTPDEIALSILAQLTQQRRARQRGPQATGEPT